MYFKFFSKAGHHIEEFFKSFNVNWRPTPPKSLDLKPIKNVCGSMKEWWCGSWGWASAPVATNFLLLLIVLTFSSSHFSTLLGTSLKHKKTKCHENTFVSEMHVTVLCTLEVCVLCRKLTGTGLGVYRNFCVSYVFWTYLLCYLVASSI